MPFVRTVMSDIDPGELGPTYCHEHLLTSPGRGVTQGSDDLVLDDPAKAARELADFGAAGGAGLVEATAPEFGRDPVGLRALSQQTGLHIIATTGHVAEAYWRGVLDLDHVSDDEMTENFVRELVEGVGATGVRAGIIKAGSSLNQITPTERRVLRPAAAAQRATGASITTHTTAGTQAMDQVAVLEAAGANLARVCIGHVDRRLVWDEHLELVRTGVYLGYDQISKDKYEPDHRRAEFIARLCEAGFGDRICLSGDLARRSYLRAWGGGPGYAYILEGFMALLATVGLDAHERRRLLVENPARLLTWEQRTSEVDGIGSEG